LRAIEGAKKKKEEEEDKDRVSLCVDAFVIPNMKNDKKLLESVLGGLSAFNCMPAYTIIWHSLQLPMMFLCC
jgi:hypothetical protein